MNTNLFTTLPALLTWTILGVLEHTGFVVGRQKMVIMNILTLSVSPPPDEWEQELKRLGKKSFLHNDNQLQWIKSVRCGYYCLLFLNERNRGTSFKDIPKIFSADVFDNERIVKKYFS